MPNASRSLKPNQRHFLDLDQLSKEDLRKIIDVSRALKAGTVHVNQYDGDDITVPFGGYKQSGNGRDKSLHAFDKYTELKTTWIQI